MNKDAQVELSYRPDIDGLRAIAVGIVVLFHGRLGLFPGGYTGVDVFFVISGFLISSILWREAAAGGFTILGYIGGFYERRIRRIFPALALIMLVTLALGALFFAPQDYFNLGRAARATAGFYSNFFFNSQFGYFMPGAETQPLLHTWSLAVEEQFYVVAPFFLLLLARMQPAARIGLFLALFVASLAISSLGALDENKAAFYLPHARAWELMLGMALVVGLNPAWRNATVREGAAVLGLVLILAAAFAYTDETPFPGLAALVPCLGTALLISTAAAEPTMVSRVLSAAPVVAVGKISYSLYLWHWPLFVFAEYEYGERLPVPFRLGLIALAVVLSVLTYWFVEQPARRRTPAIARGTVIGLGVFVMLAVVGLSHAVVQTKGWPQRLSPEVAELAATIAKAKVPTPCRDPNEESSSAPGCEIGAKGAMAPQFLLWGDSHAIGMSAQIGEIAAERGFKGEVAVVGGCPPLLKEGAASTLLHKRSKCADMETRVDALLKGPKFKQVIIAARWAYYAEGNSFISGALVSNRYDTGNVEENRRAFAATLRATVRKILASGRSVTLIGPVPELKTHLPNAVMRAKMHGENADFPLDIEVFRTREAAVLKALGEVGALPGVKVLYPHTALCSATTCTTSAEGVPLYIDSDHLGANGTKYIRALLEQAFDAPPG